MSGTPWRLRLMRLAVVLMVVFDLMALAVLVRLTPIAFTLFMFLAQPLFVVALLVLAGGLLTEVRALRALRARHALDSQSQTSR